MLHNQSLNSLAKCYLYFLFIQPYSGNLENTQNVRLRWVKRNPKFDCMVQSHVTSAISIPNYFFTNNCPLLINFAIKFYLRSETFTSYKFCAGHPKKGAFLFVRRKRHARVRPVYFSYKVMVQEGSLRVRYRWSHLAK